MKDTNNDTKVTSTTPQPVIKKRTGLSMVWLIPLVTAIIGGWLIYKTLSEKGPQITITFRTAEGIEAGKTKIKYKDIEIGVVDSVYFSDDFSRVIVNASMGKESDPFLRRETQFWVVRPRLSLRGASGLGTLLSGAYIEIQPGQGGAHRNFIGLDQQPGIKADVAGIKITLLSYNLGSLDTGSPVCYQGINVGEVLGWDLGSDRKSIFIYSFIKSPYDRLIQSNTKFWNVSGIDLSVGAEGLSLKTASLQSLLYGGIAFETPETLEPAKGNVEEMVFTLYDDYRSIEEKAFTKKANFILFFDGSVRGLNVGAPVEFKGIKVGTVKDIRLEFDSQDSTFRIPVLIEIEPERIIERGMSENTSTFQTLQGLVERGLRAQLRTGNLLTGQLFVDLDMHPKTEIRLAHLDTPYPELPTIPASMEQITSSVHSILSKLENIDLEQIGSELLETFQGANRFAKSASELVDKPEVQGSVEDFKASLQSLRSILSRLDRRVEPITVSLEDAIVKARNALENVQGTMTLMNQVLRYDSPFQYKFIELADELSEMARSIRILVDLLERNPNSLIFGKKIRGEE
ncbi:MAG: MCE family protein [Deltaproteobacteria bacterium]|nr:MCE family protein [Deltaproteobacteria bacterium]